MARTYTATEVRARLEAQVKARRPIVVAGAGFGLTAKCAVLGGADLLVIYNSGRYRMAGLPSLVGYLPVETIRQRGITVMLVEQNARLALDLADRAYVLQTGRIALEGTSADVRDHPDVRAAYLGA